MTTVCDTAEEGFLVHSRAFARSSDVAAEAFDFDTTLISRIAQIVAESFTLHSAADPAHLKAVLTESFTFGDAVSAHQTSSNIARTTLLLGSAVRGIARDVASESFNLHADLLVLAIVDFAREGFTLHSQTLQGAIFNRATETFRVSSRVPIAQVQALLAESFNLHSAVLTRQTIRNTAAESFTFDDAARVAAILTNLASESFRLHAAASNVATTANRGSDVFYLADNVLAAGAAGGGWTAPTDTFAMSRYVLPAMQHIGVLNGVVIVAGEGGFYALTGADDAGVPVDAELTSGMTDVGVPTTRDQGARDTGDPHQKRGSDVYIGYTGGALQFGIGVTSSGIEERYWYDFPAREATDPTSNRAKLGRGARSRFWRFLLRNVAGAAFNVKETRVLLNSTKRRL